MRDFNSWLNGFKDTIATWTYYTDFKKVYGNVDLIKDELNILNGLVGVIDIEREFKRIITKYPSVLKVIPILIAKRETEIKVTDINKTYLFNFKQQNYSIDEYVLFMKKTGLFDLLKNHMIHSLVDYVMGVEVGMDTNGRKNRTGVAMENLVAAHIENAGFTKNQTYFEQMPISEITKRWGVDLSAISNKGKTEKVFDFVIKTDNKVYGIETNFYGSNGSKLNETARSYKNISIESQNIEGFEFVWFTDGRGWLSAKHNLEETFDVMEHIYNINDLESGIISEVFK